LALAADHGGDARVRSRLPLWVEVATLLRGSISERGLQPGDPLPSEAELAEEYAVSQRVVREALRKLSNQGLVETRQGKRAVVSELQPVAIEDYFQFAVDGDDSAVADLFELRLALETRAASLAAERISAAELERLGTIMAALKDSTMPERVELDLEFHAVIAVASGNRFIIAILEALGGVLAAERRAGGERTEAAGLDHRETNRLHEALLSAVSKRDPELAEQTMREVVARSQQHFRELPSPRRTTRRAGNRRR
jgi:GntR family transcriptional repressor for pyruvate dehydrogenase complex